MRLRNKLLLGFAVPALLTIILSSIIYYSLGQLKQKFHWVDHTHIAIDHGDGLMSAMIDMETGLRGFLVAGDSVFLEPYDLGYANFTSTLLKARNHVSDNPAQLRRLDEIESLKTAWRTNHAEPAIELRKEVNDSTSGKTSSEIAEFIGQGLGKKSMDQLRALVGDFNEVERTLIVSRSKEADDLSDMASLIVIAGSLISILGSVVVVLLITRSISKQLGTEPGTVEQIAHSIAAGDLSQDLGSHQNASGVLAAMQTMQANLKQRLDEDQQLAAEMARLKQALDSATAPVLVTDSELSVIYQNRAAAELFQRLETPLRNACPNFSAATLVGNSICQFDTNNGVSQASLEQLQATLTHQTLFEEIILQQIFSPIIDDNGERIGMVVEWQDRTDRLAVEDQIQAVVDAALAGDLSQRLPMEGKEGFFLMLGERMNALVEICENVINDTVRVFGALSRYDLTEQVSGDYRGSFAEVKENANRTVEQLTSLIGKVKSDASMLDSASGELNELNKRMYGTAEISSDQANTVSAAVEQISANISGVASASTQMSASINEIARNASDATKIASEAVQLAESTEITVRQLSASSNDIGNVIKVINSIAEQTNLLALNATIEAARAGDAGKGFAVVANEVKDLAKETAKATEEISQKVATIQTDSDSAVEAIGGIDATIQKINEIQVMIAAAVQQQTATTNEISRSVNEAADGSNEIADNSSKAAEGAMQALSSTSEAQQSTKELAQLASELSNLVEQFKVRAA